METIEERASNIVRKVCDLKFWNDKVDLDMRAVKNLMVQFATEQDRIARQEERERCIKAALEMHCKFCGWYCKCKPNDFDNVKTDINCDEREQLRKAIEEGGLL